MELHAHIKKYRTDMNLSQEELADRVYVTRQTISNWETGKSYPDIHSLVLLGNVFGISLDQLIKGDLETMKEEIKTDDLKNFNFYSSIYAVMLLVSIFSTLPLVKLFDLYGLLIIIPLWIVTLWIALKIEKLKKTYDVQTWKEIVAFMNGERLDEITKARESGKRPYQKFLLAVGAGIFAILACLVIELIF